MATALMMNDNLSMDRINPYTWSGTFGVSNDGSHNWQPDGTYSTPWDKKPGDSLDTNKSLTHFNGMALLDAGQMWFNTMPGKPVAPFPEFPSRKYELDDGNLTWVRPDINFNYVYDKDFIGSKKLPDAMRRQSAAGRSSTPALIIGVLIVLAVFLSKTKR